MRTEGVPAVGGEAALNQHELPVDRERVALRAGQG